MTLELADGRGELFQWDAGRIIEFGDDTVSQAHFTSIEKITDIPYTIEVKNRKAAIPDELLQVPGTLIVYAWVSDTNGGYTKVQVYFPVFARPKPSDYVYTPTEHAGFDRLRAEIGDLGDLQTTAKDNLVAAINEAAASGASSDAVLYTPQTLTDEQKKQARENVAAMRGGYANQMYNASDHGLDIYSVAGSGALCNVIADIGNDSSGEPIPSPALMVCAKADRGWISAFLIASNGRVYYSSLNLTDEDAPAWTKESSQIMLNNSGALEQQTMASAPTSDMQIATKKYVDDALDGKAGTAVATVSANGLMSKDDKTKLDGITGQVTADKVYNPNHDTDLVQYAAFKIGAQQILSQIPTVLPNPEALTIQIGGTSITYDGSTAQTVTIADGTEVSY